MSNRGIEQRDPSRASTGERTLSCKNGNSKVVYSKQIPFTDFPCPDDQLMVR